MSVNVTVVDGSTPVGVFGPNSGTNIVILNNPTTPVGIYHPSGAFNVVMSTDGKLCHESGAYNAIENDDGTYSFGLYKDHVANSNSFPTGNVSNLYWVKEQVTSSTGYAGPSGALDAQRILETAVTNQHDVLATIPKTAIVKTYRFSADVKILGRNFIRMSVFNGAYSAGWSVFFDISTGVVGTNGGGGFSISNIGITSLDNGYYHCTADYTTDASVDANFVILAAIDESTISYLGDVTKGFYCKSINAQEIA